MKENSTVETAAALLEIQVPAGKCAASLLRMLYSPQAASRACPKAEDLVELASRLLRRIEEVSDEFHVEVPRSNGGSAAVESVGPDQPFILDSLLELLRVRGYTTREVLHPIVSAERSAKGEVVALGPPRSGAELVSVIRIELEDRLEEAARKSLAHEAQSVLADARGVVKDFQPMLKKLGSVEKELGEQLMKSTVPEARDEMDEALAFLAWLQKGNFVFLGYRCYDIQGSGSEATIQVEPGSGLGILRDEARSTFATARALHSLPPEQTERIVSPRIVLVHKASSDSHVLRRARMDYIGVKKRDELGRIRGEHRFLGLFTSRAYNDLPSDIPILRKKLEGIFSKSKVVPGSHDHKEIFSIFTSIPKHELFLLETDKIAEMISAVMAAKGKRLVKVSYRPDFLERGVSVMVLLPREKFSADVRVAIQKLLADELKGTLVDYRLALSDEPMARLHFYFATRQEIPASISRDALEGKVAQLVRTWSDRLAEALERDLGGEQGARLARRYAKAFPAAYVAVKSPETAVADIRHVENVLQTLRLEVSVGSAKQPQGKKVSVLKLYRPGEPFALSTLMPVLTNLGLHVLDEQTFRVTLSAENCDGPECEVFIHSFRLLGPGGEPIAAGKIARNIEETIPAVLSGELDDDLLNSLVTRAGLDRRQVAMLRAYDAYLRQLGGPWSRRTTHAALTENHAAAARLVKLFEARFGPGGTPPGRLEKVESACAELRLALEKVQGIVEDQVLRAFENLILSTLRVNYFQKLGGVQRPALAFKIRCADVHSMPEPRPLYEIFVHCAAVEGVHLRSGKVARGGIRWSSRPDDYRMEILGLMKAQRTKNAVIVPVGAKGGFILKGALSPSPPAEEIKRHYEIFIRALFDLTDNIVLGKITHPENVVVHDEEDPYLVVAADRGTAALSDTANAIALSVGFWLGDAFASGGSRGYNHKKEGITARGAWECVRRHFREAGLNIDRDTFTVAGVGDMSGDVFGNGMLYTPNIRLLAAFNHAHFFIDPDPDPKTSFEERKRLFALPGSQWTDYDAAKISAGGGIFRRDAKSIPLSARAREVLGVKKESLNGDELVRAIITMPVDLFFNGGIGTYVKSRTETHQDVSDPANNAVRVDGADLRARVVAEGGNLGFTQLGRIEYARSGGRINTDFIDNSAGVDLSDHEVNLKILLARALGRGVLRQEDRDQVLGAVTSTVCAQVLRDNHEQGRVLSLEERKGVEGLEENRFLIEELSGAGLLNRAIEKIPSDQELLRLREARMGLTRPQLAVLLAYAKIDSYLKVLESPLPDEVDFLDLAMGYFPREISDRFAEDVKGHRLRREIIATAAVNGAINTMGIAFFHETGRRTGSRFEDILGAWTVANGLCRSREIYSMIDAAEASGQRSLQEIYALISRAQAALKEAMGWLLLHGTGAQSTSEALRRYRERLARLEPSGPLDALEPLIVWAENIAESLEISDFSEREGLSLEAASAAWKQAGEILLIDLLRTEAARIPTPAAEDVQTRSSLLGKVSELRRELARQLTDPGSAKPVLAKSHRECQRAVQWLEEARTHQPLSLSALYVLVETLGRRVHEPFGFPTS